MKYLNFGLSLLLLSQCINAVAVERSIALGANTLKCEPKKSEISAIYIASARGQEDQDERTKMVVYYSNPHRNGFADEYMLTEFKEGQSDSKMLLPDSIFLQGELVNRIYHPGRPALDKDRSLRVELTLVTRAGGIHFKTKWTGKVSINVKFANQDGGGDWSDYAEMSCEGI